MPTWVYDLSSSVTFREESLVSFKQIRNSLTTKVRGGITRRDTGAFRTAAYFSSTAEPQEACMHDADFVSGNPAPLKARISVPHVAKGHGAGNQQLPGN